MTKREKAILKKTETFVRKKLAGDASGHDGWHVHRVRANARAIARSEGADAFIVQLAALLHDIGDWKFQKDGKDRGPDLARKWLRSLGVGEPVIQHVCEIIADVSYKGADVPTPMKTPEGKAVQDADRLDALGAIGIARTFAYGGARGRALHDPAVKPRRHKSFAQYKSGGGPTINHFYEKLLLLKDRMHTKTARRMAASRHKFMEAYLRRFFREWDER